MGSLVKRLLPLVPLGTVLISNLYRRTCTCGRATSTGSGPVSPSFTSGARLRHTTVFQPGVAAGDQPSSLATSRHNSGFYSPVREDEAGVQRIDSTEEGASTVQDHVFNIDVLVSLLRQENAKDLCVIKVPPEMKYTDYFVIVSGTSTRHLYAMAHYALKVYKNLKSSDDPHVQIEGKDTDDWMCIDFGSIVVHVMLPETREVYELEKLWTLRSYDDQLAKIAPESLPSDFIYELHSEQKE